MSVYYHTHYYYTCPYCGANLDPGESCDCQKEPDTSSTVTEKSKPDTIKPKENQHEHEDL